jgi:hypothetical protein
MAEFSLCSGICLDLDELRPSIGLILIKVNR